MEQAVSLSTARPLLTPRLEERLPHRAHPEKDQTPEEPPMPPAPWTRRGAPLFSPATPPFIHPTKKPRNHGCDGNPKQSYPDTPTKQTVSNT